MAMLNNQMVHQLHHYPLCLLLKIDFQPSVSLELAPHHFALFCVVWTIPA
jgi:hypothetical protein